MAKVLMITDTILRDAHQSQAATRMQHRGYAPRLRNAGQASAIILWSAGAALHLTPACAS